MVEIVGLLCITHENDSHGNLQKHCSIIKSSVKLNKKRGLVTVLGVELISRFYLLRSESEFKYLKSLAC